MIIVLHLYAHNRMRNEGRNRTIDEYIYVWTTFVTDDNDDDGGRLALSMCLCVCVCSATHGDTIFSIESLNFVMETFCFDIKLEEQYNIVIANSEYIQKQINQINVLAVRVWVLAEYSVSGKPYCVWPLATAAIECVFHRGHRINVPVGTIFLSQPLAIPLNSTESAQTAYQFLGQIFRLGAVYLLFIGII